MKLENINNNTRECTYSHNDITFRCSLEAVHDILFYNRINVFSIVENCIDDLIKISSDTNFSVCIKIEKDVDLTKIAHKISVVKIPKLSI